MNELEAIRKNIRKLESKVELLRMILGAVILSLMFILIPMACKVYSK